MSTPIRTDNPYANKASRTVKRTLGTSFTGLAATDVCTLVGGTLDLIENFALVQIAGVLAGGAGLTVGRDYYLTKLSSTTFQLATQLNGPVVNFTTDVTSTTQSLTYGLRNATDDGIQTDIV